jgi:cell division protein FtsB
MSENPLSLPSVVPADGRADVEQLERDLKRANAELATLRTERDLLQTRLQEALDDVSAHKKQ